MNAEELSIKAEQLVFLHFAPTLWNSGVHEVLPLSFLIVDHVQSGNEITVEFAARARFWESAGAKLFRGMHYT